MKLKIARWGDELREFEELKKLSIVRFIDNEGGELQREIADLTNKLNLLKENVVSYFNGNISRKEVTGKW